MVPSKRIYEDASAPSSISSARRTPLRMRSLAGGIVYGFVMELSFIASNGYIQAIFTEEGSDSGASHAVDYATGGRMSSLGGKDHSSAAVPFSATMALGTTSTSTIINDSYLYFNNILDSGSPSNGGDNTGDSSSVIGSLPHNLFGLYSQTLLLLFIIFLWLALWRQHCEHRHEEVQLTKEIHRRRKGDQDQFDGIKGYCHFWWSIAVTWSIVWTMGLFLGMVLALGIITCLPSSMLRKDFCSCWLSYILGICMLCIGFLTAYECQSIFLRRFFPVSSSDDEEGHNCVERRTELSLELSDDDNDDDVTRCASSTDYRYTFDDNPGIQQQDAVASLHPHKGNGLACSYFLLAQVV